MIAVIRMDFKMSCQKATDQLGGPLKSAVVAKEAIVPIFGVT
jgi:hypothetical protein